MGRTAAIPGKPYSTVVPVKLNTAAVDALDQMRGEIPRSTFMRELLRAEVKRKREARR